MILKQSDRRSGDLSELTRLASKCNPAQKRRLDREYKKLTVGIQGEQDAAHVMNRVFGESDRTGLLHDLRIGVRGEFAQIDHLVIHRVQGRIWLCETKAYGGRLQCNEHGEWTVWYGKKPQPVFSPIEQARLQAIILRRWLEENKFAYLEVLPLVLIAPTASLDRRQLPDDVSLVKWDQFGDWWERQTNDLSFLSAIKMVASAFREKRDRAWLSDFGEKLCEAHAPIVFDWEARLGIDTANLANQHTAKPKNVHPLSTVKSGSPATQRSADDRKLDLSPITTPHGIISFIELKDSEVAIRNAAIEPLIEAVRGTVKGKGRWQPRFRNWIVKKEIFGEVRREIETRLVDSENRRRA